jgi:hypothetical protein
MLRLPPDDWGLYNDIRTFAMERIALTGELAPAGPERERQWLRAVLQDVSMDLMVEVKGLQDALLQTDNMRERVNKMDRMRMDEYRCVRCRHTYANHKEYRVSVHHIWPKGQHGEGRPNKIHAIDNLVSLCTPCHEWAHENWRKAAVYLYRAIGNMEAADTFVEKGYGNE